MPENRKLKVFLCHSKDDKPKVRELYRRLVADGFDPWLDEEKLMPGQEWDLEIRKAVRESDVVVVCLSNGSTTKAGYVQKEIRFALDVADEQPEGAIFIIPARLENCQVPNRLSKWQWVNLFNEEGYEKLKISFGLRSIYLGVQKTIPQSFDFPRLPFEPQMVQIPVGKFLIGSTPEQINQAIENGADKDWIQNETPQHTVELPEYFIGKYPITNLEYQAFVQDTQLTSPREWNGDQFLTGKGGHPVVSVSWFDAISYCNWLSDKSGRQYRLPTEAEWEKAARGEDGRVYPWGAIFDSKKSNTTETKISTTSEVVKFSPQGDSPYGCSDMAGNIWEWCNDWFNETEYKLRLGSVVQDPQGPTKGIYRVLRGGSFGNNRAHARCATRLKYNPDSFNKANGFRIAS
ncbi:MAG: SUMF1/EgtB/PvdO family nonheme iron enzyme [Chloroflexota bacterium]